MVKTLFNFSPRTGPAILITGGILFTLVGFLINKGGLAFLGILMIMGGAGLSLYWANAMKR